MSKVVLHNLDFGGVSRGINHPDPVNPQDVSTKACVDARVPPSFAAGTFLANPEIELARAAQPTDMALLAGNGLYADNVGFDGPAPTLVTISSAEQNQSPAAATTLNLTLPAARQVGDRMIFAGLFSKAILATPSGVTLLHGPAVIGPSGSHQAYIFEVLITGSEGSSISFASVDGTAFVGTFMVRLVRGSKSSQPLRRVYSSQSPITTTNVITVGSTWGASNTLLLGFASIGAYFPSSTFTAQPSIYASTSTYTPTNGLPQTAMASATVSGSSFTLGTYTLAPAGTFWCHSILVPPHGHRALSVSAPKYADVAVNIPAVSAAALGFVDVSTASTAIDPLAVDERIVVLPKADAPPFTARVSATNTVRFGFQGAISAISAAPFRVYKAPA